jgi:hypothetical protein
MPKKYNEIEVKDNMKVDKDTDTEENTVPKERKELRKVVTVQPTKVKKGLISRLVTGVVGPDGLPGIGTYVNEEIIKPAFKNIIVDAVTSGINMIMYGERGGPPRGRYGSHPGTHRNSHRPTTNYSANYRSSSVEPATPAERLTPRSARSNIDDYVIADRYDAAHVLTTLTENADMYDSVSVADYYDLIGVPSQYTDNNHGWTLDSITRASIVPVRGGYIIKFPPVEVI